MLLITPLTACDRTAGAPAPDSATPPAQPPTEARSEKPAVEPNDRGETGRVPTPGSGEAADGTKCGDEVCTPPRTCVEYYGIAGPSGPKFQSCEVRCKGPDDTSCPEGTSCTTVADGPGQVCR